MVMAGLSRVGTQHHLGALATGKEFDVSDIETIRAKFEQYIKGSSYFSSNTPLGAMMGNGTFMHYMNPDTDTLWIGFALGYRFHEQDSPNPKPS